jgi:hypothetical protein
MTTFTADEMHDRILRSLQENSAYFANQERARRTARLRSILWSCLLFVSGAAVGALLVLALPA